MDHDPEPALRAGNSSRSSARGSGTELAIEIAARVVLPRRRDGARYEGEAQVVVIDCGGESTSCASCGAE